MSQAIFPTLPGLSWNVTRTPQWNTRVQRSAGGMELRASYYSQPIRKYVLSYDVLRASAALPELQTLIGFFHARQGSYDSFLYDDPIDDRVTSHGFGVGDGTTTAFQLQRTLAGPRNVDGYSGVVPVYTQPRIQWAVWTEQFDNAAWAAANLTVTANRSVAPDGTTSGDLLTPSAQNGDVTEATSMASSGQGVLFSVWLRADTPHTATIKVQDSVSGHGVSVDVAVTSQWQRFSVANTFGAETGTVVLLIWPGQFGGGSGASYAVYAWGAQLEGGSPSVPSAYVSNNTGSARTVNPAYWPAQGDGFEPVYNVNASTPPAIAVGGTAKAAGTDYTLSASGLVTFAVAPLSGAALTWTGQYYWRCRFEHDATEFNNFLYQLWDAKSVSFVTVKGA